MPKISSNDFQEILGLIQSTKWFNGGAGVIVPQHMADILKENGITEGYSVSQPLPTS